MKAKNISLEPVKLKSTIVNKVRKHKEKTGVSISRFIEDAIEEKFKAIK